MRLSLTKGRRTSMMRAQSAGCASERLSRTELGKSLITGGAPRVAPVVSEGVPRNALACRGATRRARTETAERWRRRKEAIDSTRRHEAAETRSEDHERGRHEAATGGEAAD